MNDTDTRVHHFRPTSPRKAPAWTPSHGQAARRTAALRCEPLADGRRDPDGPPAPLRLRSDTGSTPAERANRLVAAGYSVTTAAAVTGARPRPAVTA